MAIDSAAKRLSCLDYEEVWAEALPWPDGSVDTADRVHLIWSYAGTSFVVLDVPGCATVTDALAFTATITDALAFTATVTDALAFTVTVTDAGGCV